MSALEKLLDVSPRLMDGMRRGQDHVMVRCLFHDERTPSMSISTTKPVFFCHGCKRAGHIAQLLMLAGMTREAIEQIIPRNGDRSEPESLGQKLMRGVNLFRGKYVLDEGVLDYYRLAPSPLMNAGFTKETLRHFEVGFDYKNYRITFPLRTTYGELVGISGRTVIDDEPRYKIYDRELKERSDYHIPKDYSMEAIKSAVLWHSHVVRPFFFTDHGGRELTITEGFKACMWVWQCGHEDVVALVGSYLTPIHAELIARVTRNVTLLLDNNEAGWKGTLKAGRMLLDKGVDVRVARYPDERQQPDDLNPNEVTEALNQKHSLRAWIRDHPM